MLCATLSRRARSAGSSSLSDGFDSGNRAGLDRSREITRAQAVTGGFGSDRLIYPRACWSRYFPIGGNSQGPRLDCVLVRSSCPRGVAATGAFWAGASAMTTGDIFGLGPLSPANAGGMLPMLRAVRPARIANFMISLLTQPQRAPKGACLSNLVDLAAYIDLTRQSDNKPSLHMICASSEAIARALVRLSSAHGKL
jgi:hypothetical protein